MTHAYFSSVSAHSEWSLSWLHADAKSTPFFFFSFCLPLTHPSDALFFITIQHFRTWRGRLRIEMYIFALWKQPLNIFSTEVSACRWHSQTRTIINFYWRKKFAESKSLKDMAQINCCSICTNLMSKTFEGKCVF